MAKKQHWILISILLILILILRLTHLDLFLTPDEPLFMEQARQFAEGVSSGDFNKTLGIGYPSVTLAWWTLPVVLWIPPNPDGTETMTAYAAARVVNGLVIGGLLIGLLIFASRLWGTKPALIALILLALDPYAMGYSRLLHIAMPLAGFITLSGLSYLLYLTEKRIFWLGLMGTFAGLALLTKSTALLLIPMIGLLWLTFCLTNLLVEHKQASANPASLINIIVQQTFRALRSQNIIFHLLAIFIAAILFILLWPAMWINPVTALSLTFGKLLTDQAAGTGNLGMFWMGKFVQDPGPFFYPIMFILKATPWLLIGTAVSIWYITHDMWQLFYKKSEMQHPTSQTVMPIALWAFALTYLILMTIASKKSVRYLLPAWPTFYLLTGIALHRFSQALSQRFKHHGFLPFSYRLSPISYFPMLLLITLLTLPYHPYYLSYYNPLLMGWRVAPYVTLVGWGEGLDQTVTHLQQKPTTGVTSAWYEWIYPVMYGQPVQAVVPPDNMLTADQTILYINQVQRDIPNPNIIDYFQTRRQPEQTVNLNGIDYVWVYAGPVAGFNRQVTPQQPLSGQFGDEAHLLGYDISPNPLSGEPLYITLYWQALNPSSTNRFVYLRLLDEKGYVRAQTDSPPVMGLWPTSKWQPGMIIEDIHEIQLPPGIPAGDYQLEVGFYDPTFGQPLSATGQPLGAGGGLLLGHLQVAWQVVTTPGFTVSQTIPLANNAKLINYNIPPTTATTGDVLPIELVWQEDSNFFDQYLNIPNDYVLFEWQQQNQPIAEQLDLLPKPIEQWGSQAILRSWHEVIIPPTLKPGRYELVVMLHNSSDPAGDPFSLGWVKVATPPHTFQLPQTAQLPQDTTPTLPPIRLSGYQLDVGDRYTLHLYWQTSEPLTTQYKVFVQLLSQDNQVVAQSDQVPAEGTRPTTGWLPTEIITDPHLLSIPSEAPTGTYRLITGFYNPLTGERIHQSNGAEFITITMVELE